MKKYFAIALILLAACQPDPPEDLLRVQTGPGWGSIRYKVNFRDTVNLTTGWMLHDTIITPGAKQFNFSHGLTGNIQAQLNGLVPYSGATNHLDLGTYSLLVMGNISTSGSPAAGGYITDLWTSNIHIENNIDGTIPYSNVQFGPGDVIDPTTYIMSFKVDSVASAPVSGDSVFTDARFVDYYPRIWRGISTEGLERIYRESWVAETNRSFEFNATTGTITFHPPFSSGEKVIIELSNSSIIRELTPQISFNAAYQAVYDAMTTKPSEAVSIAQNKLVYRLDTCDYWSGGTSVWDRMDLFLNSATDVNTTGEALLWWNNPARYATNISGTTWTTLQGYTGDGVADYTGSNWNSSADAVHFTLNSATIGIYLRTNIQETNKYAYGIYNAAQQIYFNPRNLEAPGYTQGRLNNDANMFYPTSAGSSGLWLMTRRASNAVELYKNGASVVSDSDVSVAIPSGEMTILYVSGTAAYSAHQWSMFFIMDKIYHDNEAAAINTIIEAYMDDPAINTGVQP